MLNPTLLTGIVYADFVAEGHQRNPYVLYPDPIIPLLELTTTDQFAAMNLAYGKSSSPILSIPYSS